MGFVFASISDNEDVTRILGINASAYKLIAFVIGTATAGVAGALYAHHLRFHRAGQLRIRGIDQRTGDGDCRWYQVLSLG